jgi:hypothetical protein
MGVAKTYSRAFRMGVGQPKLYFCEVKVYGVPTAACRGFGGDVEARNPKCGLDEGVEEGRPYKIP